MSSLRSDLSLTQIPQLKLTQRLKQALTILEMSPLELNEYLRQEVLENPMLEEKEPSAETLAENNFLQGEEKRPSEPAFQESFYSFLSFQLRLQLSDDLDLCLGEEIVGSINEDGYLVSDLDEVAEKFKVSRDKVAEILTVVQSLEPTGVGARSLKECLLLQLGEQGEKNQLVKTVIQDHLEEIMDRRNWGKLARKLGCKSWELQGALEEIRMLDPRPGRNFSSSRPSYIVPELIVREEGNTLEITSNVLFYPRLTLSPSYQELLKDPEAGPFLRKKLSSARWLIRCLEKRQDTLEKIVKFLIEYQDSFFRKGLYYLRPLSLKTVAKELCFHESTVSRAIKGKYIDTPRGVIPLKSLVPSGLRQEKTEFSEASIREEIKMIIAREDRSNPFSDEGLTALLADKGIKMARRTVTKYRRILGIPSKAKRKERRIEHAESRN